MISFDEAIAIIDRVACPLGAECVALDGAAGRVLAEHVMAAIDSPRRDVSAMDGYAVRDEDLRSIPARLRLAGKSFAGQVGLPTVGAGECARIFTGGAVPPGADRVVVQEVVGRDGDWAIFEEQPPAARHIRAKASDFRCGEALVAAGSLLGPKELLAIAAADRGTVEVFSAPRFAILGTGDELAEPGTACQHPALIPESLSIGLAALGAEWGGRCVTRRKSADEPDRLERLAREMLDDVDLLVVTGGASVGERDYAKSMFGVVGLELLFSKVAIKPGKPVWLGRAGGKLVLGLPGNPTSAMVTARLFLAPILAGLSGRTTISALQWQGAMLAAPVAPTGDRETFLRARQVDGGIEALANQDSSAQKALVEADLLVRRRPGAPGVATGDEVEVLKF